MGMKLPAYRLALLVVAALPFAVVPIGSAWSVGPLAKRAARWCDVALGGLSHAVDSERLPAAREEQGALESTDATDATDGHTGLPHEQHIVGPSGLRARDDRSSPSSGRMATRRSASARRARPNVFVGPESIKRAIPVGGRPTSSWTNHTAEHPAGLLIQSPGALAGVIEPGDILVEAEGQTLSSFEQLLVTVKQAYERRVQRLSGRLFRKGDLVPVTVEPGW
jgi:hypothetical protein